MMATHPEYKEKKFKDGRPAPTVDANMDEYEALKRYDTVYRLLAFRQDIFRLSMVTEELTEKDIGKNIQGTIVDWSVTYALQGTAYVDEINSNIQYTVLQAALILTITFTLFITPPDLSDDSMNRVFSALIGISAINHLGCIIASTIIVGYLNRALTEADTFIAFIEVIVVYACSTIFNYIADLCALAAMIITGFDRNQTDGIVATSAAGFLTLGLLYLFGGSFYKRTVLNDTRILRFYQKYCDVNGELKDKYLEFVYKEEKEKEK